MGNMSDRKLDPQSEKKLEREWEMWRARMSEQKKVKMKDLWKG
jgi:hypothetical protein